MGQVLAIHLGATVLKRHSMVGASSSSKSRGEGERRLLWYLRSLSPHHRLVPLDDNPGDAVARNPHHCLGEDWRAWLAIGGVSLLLLAVGGGEAIPEELLYIYTYPISSAPQSARRRAESTTSESLALRSFRN
jgi:hypothetical protein